MLNSKIVKSGVAALVVVGLAATVSAGAMAHDKGGKRGGGMISKICAPDAAQKMAERTAEMQGVLNLTAEQQVLFNALQEQRASTLDAAKPFCDKVVEGERPSRELRKEIRSTMKQVKEEGEDTREAFFDSLSDDQKSELRKLRKGKRGNGGKHGMKNENKYN